MRLRPPRLLKGAMDVVPADGGKAVGFKEEEKQASCIEHALAWSCQV